VNLKLNLQTFLLSLISTDSIDLDAPETFSFVISDHRVLFIFFYLQ
jgi:hypothetical protein